MSISKKLSKDIYFSLKLVDEIYDKITIELVPRGLAVTVGYPTSRQETDFIDYDEFERLLQEDKLLDYLETLIRELHIKKTNKILMDKNTKI